MTTTHRNAWRTALQAAFPQTLPILAGYWFLGMTYGILMNVSGFSVWWPMLMATTVYSGSVEFVAVKLLMGAFHPLQAFVMSVMIGARHLFYGVSMLDRFRGTGWKKPLLVFWMSDETFSINYTARVPGGTDRAWFMLWVSVLDYLYWLSGTLVGYLCGSYIHFSTRGLDFVMTAMFTAIFMEQWMKDRRHSAALLGIGLSAACLVVFGPDRFILPSMGAMLVALTLSRPHIEGKEAGQ